MVMGSNAAHVLLCLSTSTASVAGASSSPVRPPPVHDVRERDDAVEVEGGPLVRFRAHPRAVHHE
jgi:hypothetical protein